MRLNPPMCADVRNVRFGVASRTSNAKCRSILFGNARRINSRAPS